MQHITNFLTDVVDRFAGATDPQEAWRVGASTMHRLGVEWASAGAASLMHSKVVAMRTNVPESLVASYLGDRIYQKDRWMEYCKENIEALEIDIDAALSVGSNMIEANHASLLRDHRIKHLSLFPTYTGRQIGGIAVYATSNDAQAYVKSQKGSATIRLISALTATKFNPLSPDVASQSIITGGRLTSREREVLQWFAAGLRTQRISDKMGIAEITVHKHAAEARRKLRARTKEQAIAIALSTGELWL